MHGNNSASFYTCFICLAGLFCLTTGNLFSQESGHLSCGDNPFIGDLPESQQSSRQDIKACNKNNTNRQVSVADNFHNDAYRRSLQICGLNGNRITLSQLEDLCRNEECVLSVSLPSPNNFNFSCASNIQVSIGSESRARVQFQTLPFVIDVDQGKYRLTAYSEILEQCTNIEYEIKDGRLEAYPDRYRNLIYQFLPDGAVTLRSSKQANGPAEIRHGQLPSGVYSRICMAIEILSFSPKKSIGFAYSSVWHTLRLQTDDGGLEFKWSSTAVQYGQDESEYNIFDIIMSWAVREIVWENQTKD
jgi:hypothetical protein